MRTEEELVELVRRAEAGGQVVVECDDDQAALHDQAAVEARLSFGPINRRDGIIFLRGGGSLTFRAARRSMKQAHMLQEAIKKALAGERVLVTALTREHARQVRNTARAAIPDVQVRGEDQESIRLLGGGVLSFKTAERTEYHLRGFRGEVYLVQDNGELWDRGAVPYIPEPPPKTRFERIDDE